MKKTFYLFLFFLFLSLNFVSCTSKPKHPVSLGKNSEILICTKNSVWNTYLGDSIRSIFMQAQLGLNQAEPLFVLLQIKELDNLLKKHRNILQIIISDTVAKAEIKFAENVFARPQTYVVASASSVDEMIDIIKNAKYVLFDKFKQTDFKRIQRAFEMQNNVSLQNDIESAFKLSMIIPKGFYLAKTHHDFMWLRLETNRYSQGLMIYRQELNEKKMINPDFLINWKNQVTKLYIPGDVVDSYMTTDTLTKPIVNNIKIGNKNAVEIRGLWFSMGDFMGGPYLTIFVTDPQEKYIYAFDAYVYYPSQNKRDILLQLEAIIHSVKFK